MIGRGRTFLHESFTHAGTHSDDLNPSGVDVVQFVHDMLEVILEYRCMFASLMGALMLVRCTKSSVYWAVMYVQSQHAGETACKARKRLRMIAPA